MNIYLTRHGQTEWNLEGRVQGFLDSPLTEKGINDAKKLGKRLEDVDFDIAFSSTSKRAIDTAKNILNDRNVELLNVEEIREINVGEWEGMLYTDITKNHEEDFKIYKEQPENYIPKNKGEDYKTLENRVKSFLDSLKTKDYENVLVVTHGLTSIVLLNLIEGNEIKDIRKREIPLGTALSLINYDGNDFKIVFEGDASHIK